MAFYSTQRVTSDGSLVLLPISIEYFDRSEITVFFDDVLADEGTDWDWVGSTDHTIAFLATVPDGVEVMVVRTTDIASVRHVFVDGAAFLDETMDENYRQMLHIAQEARERASIADMFSDLNMHGFHIINVGEATEPHHAISLAQYQADADGAWTARNQAVAAKDAAVTAQGLAEDAQAFAEAAANAPQVTTVAANISSVNTVAGNITNVNTVATNISNVNAVAAKTTEVTTVAGSISNVNTVAGSIANVNTVATNQTSVNTVATDIAAVQTVAADLNEPVSEIETVAGSIANVNTVGTNISSVNTCASNMAAIIDAPTQAAAAAASAAAAAASYDSFDDRYLGSKSTAPTLDNDGNALVQGALYYNNGTVVSDDKGMWVYDGAQWIQASAASQAILTVYKYTATEGQTTFSGLDDEGKTLSYTPGSVIITMNGPVLEVPSEIVASTGTSVVLVDAAVADDELNVYAFSTFNVADTYSQAAADARFVNVTGDTMSGQLKVVTSGSVSNTPTDASQQLTNNLKFVLPNNTTRRIYALHDTGSNYTLNLTGGAAIAFSSDAAGSQEIAFETHYTGNWHREQMRIDKYGRVMMPYQPCASAYRSLSGTTTGGNYTMVYDAVQVNVGSHYNGTNGRFTCPVAGTYRVTAYGMGTLVAGTNNFFLVAQKNGANASGTAYNYGNSEDYKHVSGSWLITCNAGDYLSVSAGGGGGYYGDGYAGATFELLG